MHQWNWVPDDACRWRCGAAECDGGAADGAAASSNGHSNCPGEGGAFRGRPFGGVRPTRQSTSLSVRIVQNDGLRNASFWARFGLKKLMERMRGEGARQRDREKIFRIHRRKRGTYRVILMYFTDYYVEQFYHHQVLYRHVLTKH